MSAKRRPWWATSTPDEINDLNARTWRRNAEAALFRADNDPGLKGSLDSIVRDRMQSAQRDPANPGDAGERRPFDAEAYLSFRRGEQAQRPNPQPQPESNRNLLSAITDVPAGLFGGIAGGIEDVVRGGGRAISAATDVITGDRPVNDLGNTPTTKPTVQQDISAGGRQISSGASDVQTGALQALAGGSTIVDAATGAPIRGALLNPSNIPQGVVDAIRNPQQAQLRNMGGIRSLPDNNIIGPLSIRDIVGGTADVFADVGTAAEIARGGRGLAAGARALRDATKDIPVGFSVREVGDEGDSAVNALRNVLRQEADLRVRGVPEREISAGRRQASANITSRLEAGKRAGLSGEELAQSAAGGARTGPLRRTLPEPVEISMQDRGRLFDRISAMTDAGDLSPFEHVRATQALGRALDGVGLEPNQIDLLNRVFGNDIATSLAERNAGASTSRASYNVPRRGAPDIGARPASAPPRAGAPSAPRTTAASRQAGRVTASRDRDLAQRAADVIREQKAAEREAAQALADRRKNIPSPPPRRGYVSGGNSSRSGGSAPSIRRIADEARARAAQRVAVPKPPRPSTFMEKVFDVLNIPRSIKSAFDISAPFRQGAPLSARNPREFWGAWEPMIKSFGSEDVARAVDRDIRRGAMHTIRERANLYLSPLDGGALSEREEAFMSQIASRIPGIDRSNNAYVTFLNRLRADFFDKNYTRLVESGLKGEELDKAAKELANFTGWATGRGQLKAGDLTSALTNVFFSPRLLKSRFDLIRAALPNNLGGNIEDDAVRQIARENVGAWIAQNVAALTLLSATGAAIVELDPRSTDFGQIRIGNTRVDPWAGFRPIVVSAARFLTGERKTTSGNIIEANRGETAFDFARTKLNPAAGAAVDQTVGETMLGDSVETASERLKNLLGLAAPLSPQDIYQGWQEDGAVGAGLGTLGLVGFGVNSYTSSIDLQREIAAELFPDKTFDEVMGTKGFRDQVNNDPRMEQYRSEQIPDAGSPRQQVTAAMQRLQEVNTEAEAGLRQTIDAGASGERLREAIADFKRGRYANSHALISPTVESELARDNQSAADVFAERYWSATRDPDPLTGKIDYDAIEAERADILAEAQAAGVDTEYILGNGVGTYRGTRYDDPKVRAAVEDYEDFQRSLNDTGFWDIDKQTFAALQQRVDELQGFDSFEAYKDSLIDQLAQRLEDRGMDAGVAVQRAEIAVSGHSVVQAYSRMLRVGKAEWLRNNPDLASRTIADGYISPSILNIASAGQPAPMPGSSRSSSSSLGGSSILR